MINVIPNFFFGCPMWIRKLWCFINGYHSKPIIMIVEELYDRPSTVKCGCCGMERIKVYTPNCLACPHRWNDDPDLDKPCAKCESGEINV